MVLFELLQLARVFLYYLRIEYLWHALIMPLTNRNGISSGVSSPAFFVHAVIIRAWPMPPQTLSWTQSTATVILPTGPREALRNDPRAAGGNIVKGRTACAPLRSAKPCERPPLNIHCRFIARWQ